MKKLSMEKQAFFALLHLAIRKGEKVKLQKRKQGKGVGYNEKMPHQHRIAGA